MVLRRQVGAEKDLKRGDNKENLAPTDRRPGQGTLTTYISSRDYHSTYLCGSADMYKLFSHNNIYVMGNRKSRGEIQYRCCSCVRFPTCHIPPCTSPSASFVSLGTPIPRNRVMWQVPNGNKIWWSMSKNNFRSTWYQSYLYFYDTLKFVIYACKLPNSVI
jgi:hypothetical protein